MTMIGAHASSRGVTSAFVLERFTDAFRGDRESRGRGCNTTRVRANVTRSSVRDALMGVRIG